MENLISVEFRLMLLPSVEYSPDIISLIFILPRIAIAIFKKVSQNFGASP